MSGANSRWYNPNLTDEDRQDRNHRFRNPEYVKFVKDCFERDNYTCKSCGNSTHDEPNLLLEIDHIVPVSKGGYTTEENLQTLCWKCNRSKGNKLV